MLVLVHMQQYVIYRIKCHVNVLTLINAIINMFQVSTKADMRDRKMVHDYVPVTDVIDRVRRCHQ